jgi:hypothetical protein
VSVEVIGFQANAERNAWLAAGGEGGVFGFPGYFDGVGGLEGEEE